MLNVSEVIAARLPQFVSRHPTLHRPTVALARSLLREKIMNRFLAEHDGIDGFAFVDSVLDYFGFTYLINNQHRRNIPASGRLVIVANHPIGTLDGLALIKLIGEVRRDVKVVANDLLMSFEPLHSFLIPHDNLSGRIRKSTITATIDALENEQAVIFFPAGEVSRIRPYGVRDGKWRDGFLRLARRTRAPMLPVFVDGCNSALFYTVSTVCKPASSLMLVREMFKQESKTVQIKIGEPIACVRLDKLGIPLAVRMVRRHVYRIGKNKTPLLDTEAPIAHPVCRVTLKRELVRGALLGETPDGKSIHLIDHSANSAVIHEIGRLRELSFRAVGEGTGRPLDLDRFDQDYRHLVLWDDWALELVGAYRIGEAGEIIERNGFDGLYTNSLFEFQDDIKPFLANGLELGRSFVQPRYWGKRSLDYLWYGLGAYLRQRPDVRCLFGPVSISGRLPKRAQQLLVHFYSSHFAAERRIASARYPYRVAAGGELTASIPGDDYEPEFRELRRQLADLGVSVPPLYKHYTELCEPGGVRFLDFCVDPSFGDCIDGLVLVDVTAIKEKKRRRYIDNNRLATLPSAA